LIWSAKRKIAAASLHIDAQPIRLATLAAIVCRIRQDAALLHWDGLHLFIGPGKAAVCEVEIARLLNEAL
jgi:hypothetical protein